MECLYLWSGISSTKTVMRLRISQVGREALLWIEMMNRAADGGPTSMTDQSSGILHNSIQSEKCVLSEMTCANYASGKILHTFHISSLP